MGFVEEVWDLNKPVLWRGEGWLLFCCMDGGKSGTVEAERRWE